MIPIVKSFSLLRRYLSFLFIFLALSSNAQELVLPSVAYTYDAAGNRVMALSSPGYLEAEPISSISDTSRDMSVDNIIAKPQEERLLPQERTPRQENYAADDRKHLQRSSKKNQHGS